MVLDLSSKEGLTKLKKSYSPLVIGIISKNPSIIIEGRKGGIINPIALKGVVLAKVIGLVKKEDILVTSDRESYSMKTDLKKSGSPTQIVGIVLDDFEERKRKEK